MVRCAPKPSLREASCCRVEVVKGGEGLRLRCFFSTPATVRLPAAACSSARRTSPARGPSVMVNCSTLAPPNSTRRAPKA
jgi:hypothetical protein